MALQPCSALVHGVVVPLEQALGLLPMTDDLFDEVRRGEQTDPRFAGCAFFPPGFEATLATWSGSAPVAYVEADYFGGIGSQFAAVWQGGKLILGPLVRGEDEPPPAQGWSPISQALRQMGVSADGHFDEFDAVGLGRHRYTERWGRA
jgi:hypothetical protein